VPRLLNSAEVFAWNTDKAYLVELEAGGVPVVPTTVVAGDLAAGTAGLPAAYGEELVVKPSVGAGGRGVAVCGRGEALDPAVVGSGPWVVQPLVSSVRTEGELSVFVLAGELVSMAVKVPAPGEIRVHEMYGGRTTAAPEVDLEAAGVAGSAIAAASAILDARLDYARVDQVRLADGRLAVSELELTEPGLYLDQLPGNGAAFADLVAARLGR
jgi:glutathione synthase/RimK-type ligase-like ATP-grasp enzyme